MCLGVLGAEGNTEKKSNKTPALLELTVSWSLSWSIMDDQWLELKRHYYLRQRCVQCISRICKDAVHETQELKKSLNKAEILYFSGSQTFLYFKILMSKLYPISITWCMQVGTRIFQRQLGNSKCKQSLGTTVIFHLNYYAMNCKRKKTLSIRH